MNSCFLFTEELTESSCLSLLLNPHGKIEAELAHRNFEEIKYLQCNSETTIVISSKHFSFYSVELPLISEKKARAAIPFALEERLAASLETLHFAFDPCYYFENYYLVLVCELDYLTNLIHLLETNNIQFTQLTADWFALKPNEIALLKTGAIINQPDFQGMVCQDLWPLYLKNIKEEQLVFCFNDSNPFFLDASEIKSSGPISDNAYTWLAKRLQQITPINLCQGILRSHHKQANYKRWYLTTSCMILLLFCGIFIIKGLKIYSLNNEIYNLDVQISDIYHHYFPQAKQVISPKFRISQLLKSQTPNESSFWVIIDKFSNRFKQDTMEIEHLRFQNQRLKIALIMANFEALENLQFNLKKEGIYVHQVRASKKESKILGLLELSL